VKKILIILFVTTFFYSFQLKTREVICLSGTYSYDVFSTSQRIINSDNVFVGEVLRLTGVMQYDSTGVPIPYSVYEVKVLKQIKGSFESDIVEVVYYGGIYNNKTIVLNAETKNEMELLPVQNEIYLFSTKNIIQENGRISGGANIASVPFSIIWISDYSDDDSVEIIKESIDAFYSIYSDFNDDIVFEGDLGGAGAEDGTSFTKAYTLYSGITYTRTFFSISVPMYFKFTISNPKFISAFSSYELDTLNVDVELFNSSYSKIASDDDSGYDDNFQLLYTLNAGTYYLKVINSDNDTGKFNIQYVTNDIAQTANPLSSLISGMDSVDIENEIIYQISPDFPYFTNLCDAVSMWNALGEVDLITEENTTKLMTLRVSTFSEDNNIDGIWKNDGVTLAGPEGDIPVADLLMVNEYRFDYYEYSSNQITRILTHELGHALGLHEFNIQLPFSSGGNNMITVNESEQNIMRQMNTPLQELGPTDIQVYFYLWGN